MKWGDVGLEKRQVPFMPSHLSDSTLFVYGDIIHWKDFVVKMCFPTHPLPTAMILGRSLLVQLIPKGLLGE